MQSMHGVVTDVDVSSCLVAEELECEAYTSVQSKLYKHTKLRNNQSLWQDVLNSCDPSDSWNLLPVHSDK